MKNWYMLTVIGSDRPGIVARLTQALFEAGGVLGEASMARLGGNFTVMLMVQAPLQANELEKAVAPVVEEFGLRLHLDAIEARLHEHPTPNVQVSVFGADRPGIVAEVTRALAEAGFNVLDLNSEIAGTDAQPLYVMLIDGHSPVAVDALDARLAPLRERGIEVRLTPIDTLIG